jgi:hypothetical protein
VLAVQDRLAYGPTFEAAMAALLGGADSSLTVQNPTSTPSSVNPGAPGTGTATPEDLNTLINDAAHDLSDYQQLTASGKLGEAGQKLEELKRRLEELQRRRH